MMAGLFGDADLIFAGFDKSERPTLIIRNCPPLVGHELVRSVAPSFRFAAGE
jgi:hypothetical protein